MIVSDTSPLRYLIAAGYAELVHKLFNEVLIPQAVFTELTHSSAPSNVRQWVEQHPPWLQVSKLQTTPPQQLAMTLDAGECEALQLALESHSEFILMDERLGRRAAREFSLPLIGALGVLRESYRRRFIPEPLHVLNDMRRNGFRVSSLLYREFEHEIQLIKPR